MKIKKYFIQWSFCIPLLLSNSSAWSMMCSTDANTLIPDNSINTGASDVNPGSPGSITIDVPAGSVGTIVDLDFQMEIDITWVGDLIVTLTSPAGTTVTLLNRPGRADDGSGAGGFGCGRDNIEVTFDDSAGSDAEGVCALADPTIDGTFGPTGNLSDFNGETLSGTWTLTAVDFFPADQGTFISAGNCLSVTTNPVTVSSVKTSQRGKSLIFDWQTASEAFNLGFHLWGNIDGQWQQLNRRLISAESGDSLTPVDYRRRINLLSLSGDVTEVGLSALSTSGQEDFYGPFAIGQSYGEQAVPEKIDWLEQREQYDAAREAAGYTRIKNRWVKNTSKRVNRQSKLEHRYPDIVMSVVEQGVYKITYEELLAHGIDLNRMPVNRLAVTRDDKAVPRIVRTKPQSRRIGPGTEIVFYATGADQSTQRYVSDGRYVMTVDAGKVLDAAKINRLDDLVSDSSLIRDTHVSTISFGENNAYLFALPGEVPWYDTSIRAFGQTASHLINVMIPETADLEQSTELMLSLVGGFEFTLIDADGDGEPEPNHHYRLYLNREENPEPIYEGFSNALDPIEVNASSKGHLKHGRNSVEIELIPDNGYNLDAVFYLNGQLSFVKKATFDASYLSFVVDSQESILLIEDPDQKVTSAYRFDEVGNFSEIAIERNDVGSALLNSPYNHTLDVGVNPSVWLASDQGYLKPHDIFIAQHVDIEALSLEGVDYVLIADPSLIGEDLQRFVDQQESMGRNTKVVNVDDVYQHYSNGLVVPQAIQHYLSEQSANSEFKYVLLVGGHTYNYRGYGLPNDQQLINMIPSFYRSAASLSKQIPTAVPFVDFDNDGLPDRAIGRWPVRNIDQLKNMVDKTIRWHAEGSHKDSKTSLFIADANDSFNDFALSTERLTTALGLPELPWLPPIKIITDDIAHDDAIPAGEKLSYQRDAMVEAMNQGPALTVFTGHGAPVSWGAQRLLNASVAERFSNESAPSLMIPLACYTTYYETPEIKSLSELLLTDSVNGAVALSGAALLSSTLDNENFAKQLLHAMTVKGLDLGSAVLSVKQKMKSASDGRAALVFNWVTLGDPTLSFGLPDITQPVEELEIDPQRLK